MSNELQLAVRFYYSNDGSTVDEDITGLLRDVAGTTPHQTRQVVGTSSEALSVGENGSYGGYCLLRNNDSTNYVEVLSESEESLVRLLAGDVALFRISPDAVPYVIADTANVELSVWVLPL